MFLMSKVTEDEPGLFSFGSSGGSLINSGAIEEAKYCLIALGTYYGVVATYHPAK